MLGTGRKRAREERVGQGTYRQRRRLWLHLEGDLAEESIRSDLGALFQKDEKGDIEPGFKSVNWLANAPTSSVDMDYSRERQKFDHSRGQPPRLSARVRVSQHGPRECERDVLEGGRIACRSEVPTLMITESVVYSSR